MEFRGTSAQQSAARQEPARQAGGAHAARPPEYPEKSSKLLIIIAVVAVIVVLVVACLGMMMFKKSGGTAGVMKDRYQAVFLTNGQVYFGKINNVGHDNLELTNIYYLQVQQNVQPSDKDKDAQVSLAKLGDELHGPEDKMFISRDQVLFWENLKDNAKVTEAIKQHQGK